MGKPLASNTAVRLLNTKIDNDAIAFIVFGFRNNPGLSAQQGAGTISCD